MLCTLTSDLYLFHLLNVTLDDIDILQQRHIFTHAVQAEGEEIFMLKEADNCQLLCSCQHQAAHSRHHVRAPENIDIIMSSPS